MYEDRVDRGAALLDRVRPGWARQIACDRLAMESCNSCILGQLYGDYWDGFRTVLKPLDARRLFSAAEHGFTIRDSEQIGRKSDDAIRARFAALADAWRAAIRARLDADRAGGG